MAALPDEDLSQETVRFSGFLSAFAISPDEPFLSEDGEYQPPQSNEYQSELNNGRECLLNLTRDNHCLIRCIITPPSPLHLVPDSIEFTLYRAAYLLDFLMSDDKALKNIEWVISRRIQKNLHIIGHISCLEGYKRGDQRGYSLTLRQTEKSVIDVHISLHEELFNRQLEYTLDKYPQPGVEDKREALRLAAIEALKESLIYLIRDVGIPDHLEAPEILVPVLEKALSDENQAFRKCAAEALRRIAPPSSES